MFNNILWISWPKRIGAALNFNRTNRKPARQHRSLGLVPTLQRGGAPSTTSTRLLVEFCRIGLIAAYAGELYHACARSRLSKPIITIYPRGASPSSVAT